MTDIQPKNYDHLLGKLKLSDAQLKAHFGLYQGYVKKLNEIRQKLQTADPAGGNYSFNEFSDDFIPDDIDPVEDEDDS